MNKLEADHLIEKAQLFIGKPYPIQKVVNHQFDKAIPVEYMFTTIWNVGIDEFGNTNGQKLYYKPSAILETPEGNKITRPLEVLISYFENNVE